MPYTLAQAIKQTRRYLKDYTTSVWLDEEITDFINEGIRRIRKKIPEYFYNLTEVLEANETINIEDDYKDLPCIFAASRCFEIDEQHYRGVQKRNEFESAIMEMEDEIRGSDRYQQAIENPDNPYSTIMESDYVRDVYFDNYSSEDEIPPLEP